MQCDIVNMRLFVDHLGYFPSTQTLINLQTLLPSSLSHNSPLHLLLHFSRYRVIPLQDINYWDESLSSELSSLTDMLKKVSKTSGSSRSSLLNDLTSKISRSRNILKSFKMETRLIKDGIKRRAMDSKYGDYEKRINELEGEVKWARTEGNKKELFGSQEPLSAAEEGEPD